MFHCSLFFSGATAGTHKAVWKFSSKLQQHIAWPNKNQLKYLLLHKIPVWFYFVASYNPAHDLLGSSLLGLKYLLLVVGILNSILRYGPHIS